MTYTLEDPGIRSNTNPTEAEINDPPSTPIFTSSRSSGSVKARPPIKRLMVKPIPHSRAIS